MGGQNHCGWQRPVGVFLTQTPAGKSGSGMHINISLKKTATPLCGRDGAYHRDVGVFESDDTSYARLGERKAPPYFMAHGNRSQLIPTPKTPHRAVPVLNCVPPTRRQIPIWR
jgi:glutamine synthetase